MISICLRRLGEKSIVRLLEEGKQTDAGLDWPHPGTVLALDWLYMNQLVKHGLETL